VWALEQTHTLLVQTRSRRCFLLLVLLLMRLLLDWLLLPTPTPNASHDRFGPWCDAGVHSVRQSLTSHKSTTQLRLPASSSRRRRASQAWLLVVLQQLLRRLACCSCSCCSCSCCCCSCGGRHDCTSCCQGWFDGCVVIVHTPVLHFLCFHRSIRSCSNVFVWALFL